MRDGYGDAEICIRSIGPCRETPPFLRSRKKRPFDDTVGMPRKLIRLLRLGEIGGNAPTGWLWQSEKRKV